MLLYIFNQLRGLHFIHIEILRIWGMASTHLLAPSLIDPTRPRKLPSQLLPLPFNGWLKFLLNWEIGRENFIKSFCCLFFNKAKSFGANTDFQQNRWDLTHFGLPFLEQQTKISVWWRRVWSMTLCQANLPSVFDCLPSDTLIRFWPNMASFPCNPGRGKGQWSWIREGTSH